MCQTTPTQAETESDRPAAPPADWSQPTDYERWYASALGRAYAASLERVLRPWLVPAAGCLVLDLGCGPGVLVDRLLPRDARVIGLDCSSEMVARASARDHHDALTRRFVVGSVERIPLADDLFDFVFCINCLEFVRNREAAFREIARVLRPSGMAILGVLNRRSVWEVTRRLWRPFTAAPYYRGRFFRAEELVAYCTEVGLQVDEIKTAVHFPPLPPGPWFGLLDRLDRWLQDHTRSGGGVLLCRATKQDKRPTSGAQRRSAGRSAMALS